MKALIVFASITMWIATEAVQGLSPEEIAAAIEQGKAGKTLQKSCSASGENGMTITAEGPVGRIMRAAREAKRQNRDFTAADVTPAMARPWLTVVARRDPTLRERVSEYVTPGTSRGLDYRTDFVVKSKPSGSDQPVVLKPVEPITYMSDKSLGQRVVVGQADARNAPPLPGSDMAASFDFAAFKAIPHRDVEIVVFMTDTGEQKCKISENERKALR
jgi:hypothetical protein